MNTIITKTLAAPTGFLVHTGINQRNYNQCHYFADVFLNKRGQGHSVVSRASEQPSSPNPAALSQWELGAVTTTCWVLAVAASNAWSLLSAEPCRQSSTGAHTLFSCSGQVSPWISMMEGVSALLEHPLGVIRQKNFFPLLQAVCPHPAISHHSGLPHVPISMASFHAALVISLCHGQCMGHLLEG